MRWAGPRALIRSITLNRGIYTILAISIAAAVVIGCSFSIMTDHSVRVNTVRSGRAFYRLPPLPVMYQKKDGKEVSYSEYQLETGWYEIDSETETAKPPAGDDLFTKAGSALSDGKYADARTLLKNPPILLLDEATSALDTRTEQDILATLRRVSAHRTSLSIAHRLSTIADSDLIYVMHEGRLAEHGTHSQLLRFDGLYAEMWARQAHERDMLEEAAE